MRHLILFALLIHGGFTAFAEIKDTENTSYQYKIISAKKTHWSNSDLILKYKPNIEAKFHDLELENITASPITIHWTESSIVVLKESRNVSAEGPSSIVIPPHSRIKAQIRDKSSYRIAGSEVIPSLCTSQDDACLGEYMLFITYELNGKKKDLKAKFVVSR